MPTKKVVKKVNTDEKRKKVLKSAKPKGHSHKGGHNKKKK
jgi:hypothetical protein|tara:strand:- start:2219 stop:2338 length:120 start_codon:yes stop_codon:yes gene_type:complete